MAKTWKNHKKNFMDSHINNFSLKIKIINKNFSYEKKVFHKFLHKINFKSYKKIILYETKF